MSQQVIAYTNVHLPVTGHATHGRESAGGRAEVEGCWERCREEVVRDEGEYRLGIIVGEMWCGSEVRVRSFDMMECGSVVVMWW